MWLVPTWSIELVKLAILIPVCPCRWEDDPTVKGGCVWNGGFQFRLFVNEDDLNWFATSSRSRGCKRCKWKTSVQSIHDHPLPNLSLPKSHYYYGVHFLFWQSSFTLPSLLHFAARFTPLFETCSVHTLHACVFLTIELPYAFCTLPTMITNLLIIGLPCLVPCVSCSRCRNLPTFSTLCRFWPFQRLLDLLTITSFVNVKVRHALHLPCFENLPKIARCRRLVCQWLTPRCRLSHRYVSAFYNLPMFRKGTAVDVIYARQLFIFNCHWFAEAASFCCGKPMNPLPPPCHDLYAATLLPFCHDDLAGCQRWSVTCHFHFIY